MLWQDWVSGIGRSRPYGCMQAHHEERQSQPADIREQATKYLGMGSKWIRNASSKIAKVHGQVLLFCIWLWTCVCAADWESHSRCCHQLLIGVHQRYAARCISTIN